MLATEPVDLHSFARRRRSFWMIVAALGGLGWLLVAIGHGRIALTAAVGLVAIGILGLDLLTPVRMHEGKPDPSGFRVVAVISALAALVTFTAALTGEPWRIALARGAGVALYFVTYRLLARWQRHGVAPYHRPAWYGFLLAGVLGGALAAALAGESIHARLAAGIAWALLHYGWVRWATRRSAVSAA